MTKATGTSGPKSSPSKGPKSIPGKTLPSAQPSPSKNDPSHEAAPAPVSLPTGAAVGAGAGQVLSTPHALINCKHLPNRITFLRLYYDVIRNLLLPSGYTRLCEICGSGGSPLYACLQCAHFSCYRSGLDHYTRHNNETGHSLSVDCSTGLLRCLVCKVFVWNQDLERVYESAKKGLIPGFLMRNPPVQTMEEELDLRVFTKHCVTIKGLYNLGNTCFMNSVLQPLLHIPDLVKYFLTYGPESHRKSTCQTSQSGSPCVACDLDALFVRMYNGNKKPVCPSDLLYTIWRSASEMSGYEQQDAHEFFVSLRTCLHRSLGGQHFNCPCIVHKLFAGVLQSDITCPQCRAKTETYDPFLDISLDLMLHGEYMRSIEECLENFTKNESITMEDYKCSHCIQNISDLSKRMAIRAAPKILVIHLKRFEHGSSRVKIDKQVNFPLFLNMAKYHVDYQTPDDLEQDFSMIDQDSRSSAPFKLMAVISHVGNLDSGHYTSYIRSHEKWFYIDDAMVQVASESDVLKAQAYMLFYTSLSSL